jgi:IclR family pca regulon transcriptional regulator
LAVREGLHVVYIAQEQPDRAVRVGSAVGTRLPLQRTAMGRALLAALGELEREELLAALRADAAISSEPLDEAETRAGIAAAADRGWAALDRHDDVVRLAAAIVDPSNAPVAAIALSGPAYRIEPELDRLACLVVRTAHRVSEELSDR